MSMFFPKSYKKSRLSYTKILTQKLKNSKKYFIELAKFKQIFLFFDKKSLEDPHKE